MPKKPKGLDDQIDEPDAMWRALKAAEKAYVASLDADNYDPIYFAGKFVSYQLCIDFSDITETISLDTLQREIRPREERAE